MGDNVNISMLLGAVLIVLYAMERFNTPYTIRATTTAGRYYAASGIYLSIYLATFYIFTRFPHLLQLLDIEGVVRFGGDGKPNEATLGLCRLAVLAAGSQVSTDLRA